ncbi:MAG: nucleoside deaminase, partial [Clostridia bacterium]|nr:nucleoside deaminase [Clostridia bacterium]
MTDADFMREALVEARLASRAGEMPVGCVIARDGEIVARAHNECEARRDATAHAELLAIQRASGALGDWRLNDCAL